MWSLLGDVRECKTTKCHDNRIFKARRSQEGQKPIHESKSIYYQSQVPVWNDIVTHTDMWVVLTKRLFQNPPGTFMNKSRNTLWPCKGCNKGERKHKTSVTPLLMEKQSFWVFGGDSSCIWNFRGHRSQGRASACE